MSHAFVCRLLKTVSILLPALCTAVPLKAQTSVSIHDVMQSLPGGPYLGQTVSTSGVVVGVMNATGAGNSGFYISEPGANRNSLRVTADGMPVFTSTLAACNGVNDGDAVTVVGTVVNGTGITAANTPGSGIRPASCTKTGTSTTAQSIDLANFGALTTLVDALVYTGMVATDKSFIAIQPTAGGITSAATAVTSTGQFWAVLLSGITTNNHMFRGAGIARDEYVPISAPSTVTTWAGNPQRILIDTTTFGGTAVDITVGQTITCNNANTTGKGAMEAIGLIDYTLGYARLLIFKETTCSVSGTIATSVSAVADTTHFKVGTLDVNSFLGSTGIRTTALAKATLAVTSVFGSPDVFAMQEADNQAILLQLATAVNTANSNSTTYAATVLGTETSNSGFLVNTTAVRNAIYTEVGRGTTYTASRGSAMLWDHPPLVLQGEFARVGKNYPFAVINVHMTPRDSIGDAILGPDIRTRRAAQAAAVSTLVQQYQTAGSNVIVAGNFNAYEYSDGYVDVIGVIDGSPAAASAVTLYQASNTTAALTDFTSSVAANTRYNIIERGNAAALEHILASATVTDSTSAAASLASYVNTVTQPHFSTDYAAIDANDPTTPAGLTPHDGFLVNFAIPPVPTTASIAPTALNFGNVYIGDSKTLTATVINTTTFTSTVNVTSIAISGINAGDYSQNSTCTSLAMGSTCTVGVIFAPSATGTRTATLSVLTDATGNPTLAVSLTGVGLDTTATLTPTSADFGTQILNTTSAAKVFTWTNTSSVALAISSVDASGDYNVSSTTCSGRIAANTSCVINVVFTPLALRARTGTLTIKSASSLDGSLTASLTGIGVGDVEANVDSLSFGTLDVGTASAAQTLTITNYTSAAIALTGTTVSGDYSVTANTCPATLASKARCAIVLVFTPTASGVRTGSLVITTNDTKYSVLTVALTGNGVDFSVSVAPASGSAIAGLSVSPVATITPLGGYSGAITMSCTTLATGTACAYSTRSFILAAATTDALTITTTSRYTVIGYGSLFFAPGHRGLLATLLALAGAGLLFTGRRRAVRLLPAFVALSLIAGAVSGCGNKDPAQNASYTSPGTYNILITATDGVLTHTAAYSLTVTAK